MGIGDIDLKGAIGGQIAGGLGGGGINENPLVFAKPRNETVAVAKTLEAKEFFAQDLEILKKLRALLNDFPPGVVLDSTIIRTNIQKSLSLIGRLESDALTLNARGLDPVALEQFFTAEAKELKNLEDYLGN